MWTLWNSPWIHQWPKHPTFHTLVICTSVSFTLNFGRSHSKFHTTSATPVSLPSTLICLCTLSHTRNRTHHHKDGWYVHHLGWFRSDNPVAHGGSARMQLFAAQTGQYKAPQGFGRIRVSRSGRSRRRRMHPSGPKLVWALRLRYDEGFDRCLRPCEDALRALRRFR